MTSSITDAPRSQLTTLRHVYAAVVMMVLCVHGLVVEAGFPCEPLLSAQNCTQLPGCIWNSEKSHCLPCPPCAQVKNDTQCAAMPQCQFVNSTCSPVDCSIYSASPVTCARAQSLGCLWAASAGVCVSSDCALATQWITAHPNALNVTCRWLSNATCADVFLNSNTARGGDVCIDQTYVSRPCTASMDKRSCNLQQPSNRCAFNISTTSAAASSTACVAFKGPCSAYATATTCPSYCAWYNAANVCVDMACGLYFMGKTNCTDRGCTWTPTQGGNGTCADPHSDALPCRAFANDTCPPLRCTVNSASMCVAVSGSTTANTAAASCSDFIDAFSCISSNLTCWFNTTQRACVDMPCSSAAGGSNSSAAGFFCPLPRCRNVSWHCVDACPPTYVLCTATGRCAPSQDLCVSCPASQVQCWDSSCTSSAAACPCPPYLPHRCNSTSACVANQSRCDVVCIATNVICPDLSCAPSLDQCPCPVATPFRCAAKSNACVVDSTACNASCPAAAPVACSNGACAADRNSCACDWTTPVRCPTDGNCYASLLQCPCTNATKRCTAAPYYCAANCDAVPSTCNTTTPVRCANGQCAASLRNCPCVDTAVVPQVSIMSAATTFDASKWLRLSAYVNYSVCGMDRSSDVTIVWTVAGGGRSLSTDGAQLNGTTLALPPNYISVVGQAVTIVAKGIVWTKSAAGAAVSQIVVASMSMKPYAPVPVLEFLGGAQRFVGTSERLVLNVAITDPFWGRRGSGANISWTCCTGANCSDACPANVSAFINAATMPSVVLPNIYAGTYNFTLWYLGNAITQTIIALNGTVANIKLFTRTTVFLARDPTYVYALLPNDIASASRISYSWLINGSSDLAARLRTGDTTDGTVFIIKGGNVLPAGATHNITATITVTWTSASGGTVERQMFGASSMIIVTAVVPQLSCRVSITDGSVNATALTTAVRLSAASSLTTSSASITYRFGFVDFTDGSLKWVRDVPLTAAYQDYPLLDLKTPMTVGVGVWNRAVNVTFFAVARLGGVVDAVRANCSLVINPSSANVSTLLSEQKQALDAATTSGDVSSVVSAVASMATLTTAGTNASANRDSFTNVVTALTSAVRGSNATGLSSEQRGAVVQTISSFVAAIGDANITSVNRYRLLTVLVNTINTSTSDADGTSDTAFDPVRDGPTVMATLDQLQLDVNVTKVAERLASSIASNAALGVISTLTSTNISLRAVNALAGAFNGSNLIANRSTIQIPSNFTLFTNASETSVISLRASEYRVNPLGAGGLVNRSLVSSVVDFAIDQDGVQTSVSGLAFNDSILLNISIDVSEDAHNNGTGHKNYTCAFYDYAQSRWSTSGVTTLNVDIASKTVLCGTQHLSTFSVSSNDSTTETAAPSETTTTPAPQTNTTTTTTAPSTTDPNNNNGNDDGGLGGGAIAGIVIGVLVVIGIVVAVIVMKMRGGNSDATNSKHKVGSDGYDRGNQHELPALELPSHHNGPVNQQHNDQFTEL